MNDEFTSFYRRTGIDLSSCLLESVRCEGKWGGRESSTVYLDKFKTRSSVPLEVKTTNNTDTNQ